MAPDREGALAEIPQLYGRSLAMRTIIDAGGDRVAVFGLCNEAGLPIYVHSKTCVIDHRWASVGSDNLNRRSWTGDSEIACTVVDGRGDLDDPAPEDAFPRVLLRTLVAEHLGCEPDDVPEDPHELFDAMVACADALDEWYEGGGHDAQSGIRGRLGRRLPHRIAPVPRSRGEPSAGSSQATRTGAPPRRAPVPGRRTATRPVAPTGGTGADSGPADLGTASLRPVVRPRRSTRPRSGELTMAKKKTEHRRLEHRSPRGSDGRRGLRPGPDGPRRHSGLGRRQARRQEVRRPARRPAQRAAGATLRRGPSRRKPSPPGDRAGARHRRQGGRRPARPEQGRPSGVALRSFGPSVRGGAEAPLPVADPQGAARPRPHRGLRPVALRGRAGRAGRRVGAHARPGRAASTRSTGSRATSSRKARRS